MLLATSCGLKAAIRYARHARWILPGPLGDDDLVVVVVLLVYRHTLHCIAWTLGLSGRLGIVVRSSQHTSSRVHD